MPRSKYPALQPILNKFADVNKVPGAKDIKDGGPAPQQFCATPLRFHEQSETKADADNTLAILKITGRAVAAFFKRRTLYNLYRYSED